MQEVMGYPHGTFSWVDLAAREQASAKNFYMELFGWDAVDNPVSEGVVYTMFLLNGKSVAGLSQMGTEQVAQGMPSIWSSYVTVDDLDETAAQVEGLGGMVLASPFEVMEAGRMAVVQDPTGATFSLWEAKNHIGASYVNVPTSLGWNELNTRDSERAVEFYNELLGWTAETRAEPSPYTTIFNNGRMNGGVIQMTSEWGDMPSHWMVYFSVVDCDGVMAKATKLGGKVVMGPIDAPGVGRFAIISDPQGGVFTAIHLFEPEGPPSV